MIGALPCDLKLPPAAWTRRLGLGLAHHAEAHGGRMALQSDVGRGDGMKRRLSESMPALDVGVVRLPFEFGHFLWKSRLQHRRQLVSGD